MVPGSLCQYSILISLTVFTLTCGQSLIENKNCKSDYYIKEYHYHQGTVTGDRHDSTPRSENIPTEMRQEREIASLQKELIAEKNKRQKDIHYMLRIVDRLLKRKEADEDAIDLDPHTKVTSDDRDEANDTTDLRQEWETSTKNFRKDRKRGRKDKGNPPNYPDNQLRSDEGRPLDPSGSLNEAHYDDVTKVLNELQEEVKGLQARQVQMFRSYKRSTMSFKRSATLFRQTMDKHQRLQMFHTSEVARLQRQLNNQTSYCQERMRQMEYKLECVTITTGSVNACRKFNARAKSKQIRDVTKQVDQIGTQQPTDTGGQIKPKTLSIAVEDPSVLSEKDYKGHEMEEAFERELVLSEGTLLGGPIDALSSEHDTSMTLAEDEHVTDIAFESDGIEDGNLEEGDTALAVGSPNTPVTSLSVKGLWEILVLAGKSVVKWSEMKQSEKLPRDCSDFDLWSQRWSPRQTVFIGESQTPLQVECHEGWLIIQQNNNNSTTDKSWDSDSYDVGIQSRDFFWIGNRYLNLMTSGAKYSLRVELGTFDNKTIVTEYSSFKVSNRDRSFRLTVDGTTRAEAGDILGGQSLNPVIDFDYIVPILPVTLPSGGYEHKDDTYREVTTLRGWWYPRRFSGPNTTTAQTHLLQKEITKCFTHLNAENPFYCDINGDVIMVQSTKMMLRRNIA